MQITLIDYGAGNLPSVERAFKRLGVQTVCASGLEAIRDAEALVLPGVGHFGAMVRWLWDRSMYSLLRAKLLGGSPFLGICLGMQWLYEASEEFAAQGGVCIFPGSVSLLPSSVKLPHMGWNQIKRVGPSRLLAGIPPDAWFYFAHSFARLGTGAETVACCEHGTLFTAALESKRVFGVQFHPEKSGDAGMQILKNFLEAAR
jgi:imidazole glycerol phosphate synthase glutamine amidotransferase subunit